jgi:hypothetical protein
LQSKKWYKCQGLDIDEADDENYTVFYDDGAAKRVVFDNGDSLFLNEIGFLPGFYDYSWARAYKIPKSQYDSLFSAWVLGYKENRIKYFNDRKLEVDTIIVTPLQITREYTLIDYWFIGCLPCHKSLPNVNKLYSLLDTSKLFFASLNTSDAVENVNYFKTRNNIPYPVIDKQMITDKDVFPPKVAGYPTLLLMDKEGNTLNSWVGQLTDEKLDEVTRKLKALNLLKN